MSEWNIPGSVDEFFANGPTQYLIIDPDYQGDNVYAMGLFFDSVPGLSDFCVEDEGTLCHLEKDGRKLAIHSGGLGDFHMHGYDVEEDQ